MGFVDILANLGRLEKKREDIAEERKKRRFTDILRAGQVLQTVSGIKDIQERELEREALRKFRERKRQLEEADIDTRLRDIQLKEELRPMEEEAARSAAMLKAWEAKAGLETFKPMQEVTRRQLERERLKTEVDIMEQKEKARTAGERFELDRAMRNLKRYQAAYETNKLRALDARTEAEAANARHKASIYAEKERELLAEINLRAMIRNPEAVQKAAELKIANGLKKAMIDAQAMDIAAREIESDINSIIMRAEQNGTSIADELNRLTPYERIKIMRGVFDTVLPLVQVTNGDIPESIRTFITSVGMKPDAIEKVDAKVLDPEMDSIFDEIRKGELVLQKMLSDSMKNVGATSESDLPADVRNEIAARRRLLADNIVRRIESDPKLRGAKDIILTLKSSSGGPYRSLKEFVLESLGEPVYNEADLLRKINEGFGDIDIDFVGM